MKKILLITLAIMAVLTGGMSCQKINDIDKRLSAVESSLSQLEAQIAAGAYITSVETSADGVTFTLSNGKTYTVANGKDGEAVIADVRIEGDYVVLTLKDGEIMRLSYQNPLSMVTLEIIPDFSDGSVYSFSEDGTFFLRVGVTPANYIEKLLDDDSLVCKADFRRVITKAIPENPDFTVVGEIASASVEEGCLTASFTLSEDEMNKLFESDYVVSLSIEDTDGVHGASTSYVPVSWYSRDGIGGDELVAVDMGLSVKWANVNLGSRHIFAPGDNYAWGGCEPAPWANISLDWSDCPNCRPTNNYTPMFTKYVQYKYPDMWCGEGLPDNKTELELIDDAASAALGGEWRMPTKEEFEELINNCEIENQKKGKFTVVYEFKSKINGNSIILPANTDSHSLRAIVRYWTSSLAEGPDQAYGYNTYTLGTSSTFGRHERREVLYIRPVYGKVKVSSVSIDRPSLSLKFGSSTTLFASVHPSNAMDNSVVWSSTDPNVVSVDAQGNVTGVSMGEAIITATTNDGGFTATCKVTVVLPDPKTVDLGLSVKWADINLGASVPEASGDYYAWGATEPNPGGDYSWSRCPYCSDGYGDKFSKYVPMGKMSYWGGSGSPDNKRKLESCDDAATVRWGGKWRTPTSAEFEELFKSCDTEWTTVNNVNGMKFTSKTTGNSIFLPAAGRRNDNSLNYVGEEGLYMSSSLATDIPDHSESLKISSVGARESTVKRNYGLTIRAVIE